MDRRPQLITYPDSLGGDLPTLTGLLTEEMAGWFPGGVHVLPPFPSTADRGFAPTRYDRIEPRFGAWSDLEQLAASMPVTVDVMVNHISRQSPEFRDFEQRGRQSPTADMFMRPDKVWPDGQVTEDDLRRLFLRRPGDPFLEVEVAESGTTELVWATFGSSRNESDQVDLDWRSPLTQARYDAWLAGLAEAGVAEVRLDAAGYLSKERGTTCFMVEPQIWDALESLVHLAERHDLAVLPEVHAEADVVARLDQHGYRTYDFVLPGLMLDALRTARSDRLVAHLSNLPPARVTMLDCHDGIPIQPDLVGVLPRDDMVELTETLVERGANLNRIVGAADRGIDFDAHQVNISYLDAAGGDDGLAVARAVQLFSPGRPQVYYQGLLGGPNDDHAVAATGEGRAVNRHDFGVDEVRQALASPVVERQRRLIEIRSTHPAFDTERPAVRACGDTAMAIRWESGDSWCELTVDLEALDGQVAMSPQPGLEAGPV